MPEHTITLNYTHRILFSREVFQLGHPLLKDLLQAEPTRGAPRVLVFLDAQVLAAKPSLFNDLRTYATQGAFSLAAEPIIIPGGEACKNDFALVQQCWQAVNDAGLDRHSYIFVIGGGAVLDLVCFAASTAHRGIRHIRFPTTTLSQGDGGVGVKNGVNFFGKKNWVGAFAIPHAVVNDFAFLDTLPAREKRCGLIEGIKVALIRDAAFYAEIQAMAQDLATLQPAAVERVVRRSAELHVEHIATGGDPFELGSARPLDFGHWAAHKLEQVSQFKIAHGEAVAMGMAIDLLYSVHAGILARPVAEEIIHLIQRIGFQTYSADFMHADLLLTGLEEFREHLGGELTVTLVPQIGHKIEVHEMHPEFITAALAELSDSQKA
jgi:3-dehydroquinate synthase